MSEEKSLVVLFADITGSTTLYERYGDKQALELVSDSLATLMRTTADFGGTHIKTIGDEVMSTFETPDAAGRAAMEMQRAHEGGILSIKIGFHYGPVIHESDDVFGDAVNTAARMASLAKRDEIITTESTVDHMSPDMRNETRYFDTMTVKGKEEAIGVYQLIWQEDDLTMMAGGTITEATISNDPYLIVVWEGNEMRVGPDRSVLSVGREVSNDIVVAGGFASRYHAKIEHARGRFLLTDQSSNGTFIVNDDAPDNPIFVKRESVNLRGAGRISLGQKPGANTETEIAFRLVLP